MSGCRTGCKTKDHASYAECLRGSGIRASFHGKQSSDWDKELNLYRDARMEGIQPATTKTADIEAAVAFSDKYGTAYDASDGVGTLVRSGLAPDLGE